MGDYARVAHIVSTRHLDGSVVCRPADPLPFLLAPGQTAHFVPPLLKGPRKARVEEMSELGGGHWAVSFAGVDSVGDAEPLVGLYCLVAEDELDLPPVEDAPSRLVGWEVEDERFGPLGSIGRVQEGPAQTMLVVEGVLGEVLIPFVDEFVRGLDDTRRCVAVALPEGLIGLNKPRRAVGADEMREHGSGSGRARGRGKGE